MRKKKIVRKTVGAVIIVAIYILLLIFQGFLRSKIGDNANIIVSVYGLVTGALLGAFFTSVYESIRFGKSTF